MRKRLHSLPYRYARRIVISIVGGCMVLVGVAMIVLPGPAFIVIPAGLGVLALEFAWARLWLKKIKAAGKQVMNSVTHSDKP
jgi:tellurite resistance protein TerC